MNPLEHLKHIHVDYQQVPPAVILWCDHCKTEEDTFAEIYISPTAMVSLIELNNAGAQHIHDGAVRHDIHQETASGD